MKPAAEKVTHSTVIKVFDKSETDKKSQLRNTIFRFLKEYLTKLKFLPLFPFHSLIVASVLASGIAVPS